MSFLYENRIYSSEKNGAIRCVRFWGSWSITVDGLGQTTPYTNRMWKKAIGRIPQNSSRQKILLLGLAAGGMIHPLHSRFPKCEVTVIEWDPVMIQIAKDLQLYSAFPPRIILGDALEETPKLNKRFDLIFIDLFTGSKVANAVYKQTFASALARLLKQDGYLIVNAFREPEVFSYFDPLLSRHISWRFKYNSLALYRHFGQGRIEGDPLPIGYISPRQSIEYLRIAHATQMQMEVVGKKGRYGTRWHFGPLVSELYETDQEPLVLQGPARVILWQPLSRTDKPKGWHRSWNRANSPRTGFAQITNPEYYWESWSAHAKRHRKKWLSLRPYTIEETQDVEKFVASYRELPKLRKLKNYFIGMARRRKQAQPDLTHLFTATDKEGKIVAGLVVLDTPESNHSHHLLSFIYPSAESTSVGTGLIDYWFVHAIAHHIQFLNFGVFWTPGDPYSWKGFSEFKSQFGIFFIQRPRPLIKLVWRSR